MKLTYYSYAPFDVQPGRITVLGTASSKIYLDLVTGLRNDQETVTLASDQFELRDVERSSQWYGDPMLEVNLNTLFQRKLQAQLLKVISAKQTVQLTDDLQKLLTQILGDSYLLDVPLSLPETPILSKLIKFSGLQVDDLVNQTPSGILETLVKSLVELNDQRMAVLANVSHYVSRESIQRLTELVSTTTLPILIIEFSEYKQNHYWQNCDYHYIDSDFVLWSS